MWRFVVWVAVGTAVYLSFIDSRAIAEVVAGVLVSAGSVWLAYISFRAAGLSYRRDLPRLWRLRAMSRIIATECWAVFLALVRDLSGREPINGEVVAIPVDHEPVRGPGGVAFDAAITVEAGIAPNTFIIGLAEKQQVLVVHRLVRLDGPEKSFPRWSP